MKLMKKIILFTCLAILTSCSDSDKLTKAKAKSILEECFTKNKLTEKYAPFSIKTGKNLNIYSNDKLETYKKLEEKGYIKLTKNGNSNYSIELTEKVKKMTLDKDSNPIDIDILSPPKEVYLKAFKIAVDEIKEIHIIPEKNIANVKFTFKAIDKTDFYELLENNKYASYFSGKKDITREFRKSTDGWVMTCKGF